MKNKAYQIVMSRGDSIKIDSDEIPKVIQAITSKSPAIVRSGIFNPSFYVSIIEDTDRMEKFWDDTKYPDEQGKRLNGPNQIKDIFEKINLLGGLSNKKDADPVKFIGNLLGY